jgi:PhnB protein
MRMPGPDGRIGHAEVRIGSGHVMLADENPAMGYRAPSGGGNAVSLLVYADDCDAVIARARAAGAKVTREPADQFYGDRSGGFTDPFGHDWYVSTHVRDVSEEEMRRMAQERASAAERQ